MSTPPREPTMTRERWRQIEALVDGALDRPPSEREAWLRAACGTDPTLLDEVMRLLDAADAPDAMLSERTPSFAALVAEVERDERSISDAPANPPTRIGAWRIVAPAGEGGMGTVYAVERDDGEYRMNAALKVVRSGLHLDTAFVRRFREERQILARLDHPNVARLLDGGVTDDGRPYYVMELVDGAPIDRWCDDRCASIEDRLELFAKVCDGVAAAHAREIVHRDLKPSNVLVTARGEPKLLDFGIAKTLAPVRPTAEHPIPAGGGVARSILTRTGERLLTPEYASPEQVRGENVTPATDVYTLGVLLYELLTGQRPYHSHRRSRHDMERAILEELPTRPSAVATRVVRSDAPAIAGAEDTGPRPSAEAAAAARGLSPNELRRRLRGDLDTIVLAALRKEPDRRYPTAAELGADVRRHLEGKAVLARGDSVAYRVSVWAMRHRRTVIAAAVGMTAGLISLIVFASRVADRAAKDAMTSSGLAEPVSTRSPAAVRYYADALRAYASGNWGTAARLFSAAVAQDSSFAIAAAYGSAAANRDEDYPLSRALLDHSLRDIASASERERFVVMAFYLNRFRDPRFARYVDSLSQRFPRSIEAALWRGRVAMATGNWSRAAEEFRQVIARDPAATRNLVPCHACEARIELVLAHVWADSLEQAEREARELTELQPTSAGAWQVLAVVETFRGSSDERAFRRRVELDPGDADYGVEIVAERRLRQGDFAAADALLRGRLETAPPGRDERSLGWLVSSLRMQERWPDALALARRFRVLDSTTTPGALHPNIVYEALTLLESGRLREAAAVFDSLSRWPAGTASGHRAWHLTHKAAALAALGDTAGLSVVRDTVRAIAPLSGYGRDHKLHHHVDGLILAARGRDSEAVEAFRRAIFSWNLGYTRTNLELGRALLRLGRPREAVAALQPALRGSLEVNNTYVTHTELHRTLAEAWRAAGNADSAAVHSAWVRNAVRGQSPNSSFERTPALK